MKSLLATFLLLLSVSTLGNCFAGSVEDINDLGNSENEAVPNEKVDISARELEQFLEKNDADVGVREKRLSCSCSGLQCSCCQRVNIPAIKFNENCCATVRYLKKDFGIAVTVTVGSRATFRKEISARDPPPLCFPVPYTGKRIQACADFYDMVLSRTYLRGCLNLLVKVPLFDDPSFHLGCFNFYRQRNKRTDNFSYDGPALIETAAESAAIEDEPRDQRLNDDNQPLNDEDVALNERFQELEEAWQDDQR